MNYDLDHIVRLVDTLYTPNQEATVINECQRELHNFQRQIWAPQLAHDLLQTDKQTSQFIGAVTYTVFITNNEKELNESFSNRIISEIVSVINRQLDKIVIQKMLSNLSKLITVLKVNLIQQLFHDLAPLDLSSQNMIYLGLMTIKNLSDELSRGESRSLVVHQLIHDEIWPVAIDILNSQEGYQLFKSLWYETLSSCISYISKAEFDTALRFNVNPYISICIDALGYQNDSDALDLILEIYDTNQSLINHENKLKLDQLIFSDWCLNYIDNSDLDDNEKIAKFITLFMEGNIISLAAKLVNPDFEYKFQFLLNLTDKEGLPIIEEPFSKELLNFWVLFAEAFDYDYDNVVMLIKDPQKVEALKVKSHDYFLKLSAIYWKKCHLLPKDELNESDDSFRVFRRDVGELFEGIFTVVKYDLFNSLTSSIINNMSAETQLNDHILDIETSLYLLNSISSVFTENNAQPENIQAIAALFSSSYFTELSNMMTEYSFSESITSLTPYLARTTILFVSEIAWFYKLPENAQSLPIALNFLFKCLQSPQKNDGFDFQESSSKAILKISNECRSQLLPLVATFEMAANSMLQNQLATPMVKSRIIRSYAAILESGEDLNSKATTIARILDILKSESLRVLDQLNMLNDRSTSENVESLTEHLLSLLTSLTGLAKGLELPTDWEEYFAPVVINDNQEVEEFPEPDLSRVEQILLFWLSDPFEIHNKSIDIINVYLEVLKSNSSNGILRNLEENIMSQIIAFFKSGLSEAIPGPFVLPYERILEFIARCSQDSQSKANIHHLSNLMELYSSVIRSVATDKSQSLTLIKLLTQVKTDLGIPISVDLHIHEIIGILIFKPINSITEDPDLLQAAFSMLGVILTYSPGSFLSTSSNGLPMDIFIQIISLVLHETLKSKERFVIKSVCEFWIAIVHNKRYNKAEKDFINLFFDTPVSNLELSNDLNQLLINRNPTYGHLLCHVLFLGLLNTARSNVDFFAEVLRIYIGDFPGRIKNWLEYVMNELIASKMVEEQAGVTLIKKLVVSRGQRVVLRLIKEWWRETTGAVDFNI